MGTLGIITQVTVKVRPIPEASAIAWVPLTDGSRVAEALDRLNTSGTRPIAIDLLSSEAGSLVGQGLGMPTADRILVIGYEDNAHSVRWQLDRLRNELPGGEFAVIEGRQAASLWDALSQFQAAELGPISFVANLQPSQLPSFVDQVDSERWSIQAHAGSGIVRAHALGDWTLGTAASQVGFHRQAALNTGGDLILSRCPTEWKDRLRVWGSGRPDWSIAERVNKALDPHGAMNPGRFVGTI
jgi:glycolate oxidase FAD binding subunit